MGDVFFFVALSAMIFFFGHYGYNAGWWGLYVYAFLFCSLAGLFMGLGVLKAFFSEISFLNQLMISFFMTAASIGFSLILLKVLQHRK